MLGFPGETEAEMKQTVAFAKKSKLHLASFNFVNAFPGTELYELALSAGMPVDKVGPEDFDFDDPPVALSKVPPAQMPAIGRMANSGFYLNPIRLARIFFVLPNKAQFFGLFQMFVKKVFLNLKNFASRAKTLSSEKK
jgi:radical SAM superfamily enzyme YgiQ (UPF0313 family)